jgi:hypothetical protein
MAAKFTRLTHKMALQLHLVAENVSLAVLVPGGQSGNFWIHSRTRGGTILLSSHVFYFKIKTED